MGMKVTQVYFLDGYEVSEYFPHRDVFMADFSGVNFLCFVLSNLIHVRMYGCGKIANTYLSGH